MNTQQVTETTTKSVYSSFVLTDLLKMASPQGVLFNLKNPQEVMQTFESIIMQSESILNFHHVRLLQGGIEVDLFVMSSLASSLFTQNSNQHTTPISPHNSDSPSFAKDAYPSTASQSRAVQVDYKMIEEAVNQIFQYKYFHNNNVMNESYLNHLLVVEQARQAWLHERRPQSNQPNTPSNQNKASTLRKFLTKCLDDHLCPEPGKSPPKVLSNSDFNDEWIEYLILRQQYVDGKRRKWVKTRLQNIGAYILGGTYGRRLKKGRERLAEIIWNLEMQVR